MTQKHQLEQPDFLSVPEVARLCGVTRNTIFTWVRQGKLPAYQTPGRTNLIRPSELKGFMEASGMYVSPGLAELATKDAELDAKGAETTLEASAPILIVDDDPLLRRLIVRTLAPTKCLQAETGYEGLHQLTSHPSVKLVFLDVRMPGVKGDEIVPEIKRLCPECAIIVMTGFKQDVAASVLNDPAVKAVLEKPLDLDEFKRVAEEVLSK